MSVSAYQVDDASWVRLVFSTLGKEQQTLSRLCSMRGVRMCDVRFFVGHISGEVLMFHRLVAKPEELLREDKAPNEGTSC